MIISVNVNTAGYAYLPKNLRDAGFTGEVEAMPNHFTVALFLPGSTMQQRKESLELLIRDMELQLRGEGGPRVGEEMPIGKA